jgi:regulator of RNase E activity RraB
VPVDPPVYDVNPEHLDDDTHPTSAWTVGEHLDPDTIDLLEKIARGNN